MRRNLVVAILLSLFAVGCAEQNAPTDAPHPLGEQWVEGDAHPNAVEGETGSGRGLDCWDCHVEELWNRWGPQEVGAPEAVLGPFYCHNCHLPPDNPHEFEGWLDPDNEEEFHGDYAEKGFIKCAGCHGMEGDELVEGINCFNCHFGFTEDPETHGEAHQDGVLIPDAGQIDICEGCHEAVRNASALGLRPPKCNACHADPTGEDD